MVKVLIKSGASIKEKNVYGETALHKAVRKGNLEIVKLLIENSAEIDSKDNNQDSPLCLAYKMDLKDIFYLLVKQYSNMY